MAMWNYWTRLTIGLASRHLTLAFTPQGTSISGRCQPTYSKDEFGQCEFWWYEDIPTYLHIGAKSALNEDNISTAVLLPSLQKFLGSDSVAPKELDEDIIHLYYFSEHHELHITVWTTDTNIVRFETVIQNNLSADFIIELNARLYNFKDAFREELPVPTEEEFRDGKALVSLDDISISFKQGSIAFGDPDENKDDV